MRSSVSFRLLVLATLTMSLALAPNVSARPPGYDPDYPQYCLGAEDEAIPHKENATGKYTCTTAIWTKCDGIQYATPCKICDQYSYEYPPGNDKYTRCRRIPGVGLATAMIVPLSGGLP